jgi:hypothetical protein
MVELVALAALESQAVLAVHPPTMLAVVVEVHSIQAQAVRVV